MARLWLHDYDVGARGAARRSAIEPRSVRPVTNLASSDEEDGIEPSERYCMPRHVTAAGRRAFHEVMRGWAAQLAEQMEIDAQRAHRADPVYTAIQVRDARRAVERQNALRAEPDRSDHRVLAAILLTIGTIGISVLSNLLVGPWLAPALAAFVIVLVAGLVLTWAGSTRTPRGTP